MNRRLQFANLVGVIALTALCLVQWRTNRELNLESIRRQSELRDLNARLNETESDLSGYRADLDHFRQRLTQADDHLSKSETQAAAAARLLRQQANERAQLMASVTNWAAAVAARDERLKTANERARQLALERDEAVRKFNELAAKYNALVKDLRSQRTQAAQTNISRGPVSTNKQAPQPNSL